MRNESFLEKIIQQVLFEAEEIKGEAQKDYGENSVEVVQNENQVIISLKENKNIYRELGTMYRPPSPKFYRAYADRRKKLLKNIAKTAKETIRLEE